MEQRDVRFRDERFRSKAYLDIVRQQPCLICRHIGCDPHHLQYVEPKGTFKASDRYAVPLCRKHHERLHQSLCSEKTWWTLQVVDPLTWADTWYKAWCYQTGKLDKEKDGKIIHGQFKQ